jgi:hypothetical protein
LKAYNFGSQFYFTNLDKSIEERLWEPFSSSALLYRVHTSNETSLVVIVTDVESFRKLGNIHLSAVIETSVQT